MPEGLFRPDESIDLHAMVRGLSISQMIGVACRMGVADALGKGEVAPIPALAKSLSAHPGAMRRLCRTLSAFGIFRITKDGHLQHNSKSLLLRRDSSPSLHWAARFWTMPSIWATAGALHHTIRTGRQAFEEANGIPFFEHFRRNPEDADVFDKYMAVGYPGRPQEVIAEAIELGGRETVVDVGGGTGALLIDLLRRWADLRGVLYEQPSEIDAAKAALRAASFEDRCETVPGDFLAWVPEGGDVYILSWILHDWPDDDALRILQGCRKAMKRGARLILIERLLRDDPQECDAYDLLVDLHMMMFFRGMERTASEFNTLMERAGFNPIRQVARRSQFSVLETEPA
jgi:hypothetical protein